MLSDIHFDPFDDPKINVPEGEPLQNWQGAGLKPSATKAGKPDS
jgi:hypothetical protein